MDRSLRIDDRESVSGIARERQGEGNPPPLFGAAEQIPRVLPLPTPLVPEGVPSLSHGAFIAIPRHFQCSGNKDMTGTYIR